MRSKMVNMSLSFYITDDTVQRMTQPNSSAKNPVVFASACLLFSLKKYEATSPSLHELSMAPFLFLGGQSYADKHISVFMTISLSNRKCERFHIVISTSHRAICYALSFFSLFNGKTA